VDLPPEVGLGEIVLPSWSESDDFGTDQEEVGVAWSGVGRRFAVVLITREEW